MDLWTIQLTFDLLILFLILKCRDDNNTLFNNIADINLRIKNLIEYLRGALLKAPESNIKE